MSWRLKERYRAILSLEEGYYKKKWGEGISVCLAYPNAYRTGMSNLGFQTVYRHLNQNAQCLCERVFLPERAEEEELKRGDIPLFSLESQRPLQDFDILAFSLPFENDYPNILKILDLGRISLLSGKRKKSEPFVMAGGIAVTLNPEPLAAIFDLFLLGEGEEALDEFCDRFGAASDAGLSREELLFALQKDMAGIYVPRFFQVSYRADHLIERRWASDQRLPEKIKTRRPSDLNAFRTEQRITAKDAALGEMFLVEVSRGCRRGCRFCAAGFIYSPARFRQEELLKASFLDALKKMKKIGLLGTAVSDHPALLSLCRFIRDHGGDVAIGSLRLDRIDRELLRELKEGGVKTVSLAPEAGSQRLRDMIHKGVHEGHIFSAVELLAEQGIPNLRLYFMVGLPTEDEEDIDAIVGLTKKIKHLASFSSLGKRAFRQITLSVNQFIPKAATPFQWCPLADINVVKQRVQRIENAFRRDRSVRVIHDLPKWNYIQALLSLGDRRVGAIILASHEHDGNWPRAMKEVNINPDFYVYRQKDTAEMLPWDFIDHGVPKALLLEEYKKSLSKDRAIKG